MQHYGLFVCSLVIKSPSHIGLYIFSLLLGVDEERRQIACGLVDTIGKSFAFPELWTVDNQYPIRIAIAGSYTFAKTLEYKAKQNLQSGKETTVIPPNEYHARFVNAINNYFLPCPGARL